MMNARLFVSVWVFGTLFMAAGLSYIVNKPGYWLLLTAIWSAAYAASLYKLYQNNNQY